MKKISNKSNNRNLRMIIGRLACLVGLVVLFTLVNNTSLQGQTWDQIGQGLVGESSTDQAGFATAISANGNRVAVGAPQNDDGGSNSGHVRVYDWDGTSWVQAGADLDGETSNSFSARTLDMSADGNRLAIGAPQNAGSTGANSGHVRVYDWNGSAWVQAGSDIDGEASDDRMGTSVALSADGNRMVAGGVKNDGGGSNSGHARVYNWDGSSWVQMGADINGEASGDYFGAACDISADGSVIAVGAHLNDGGGTDSGHVRLFEFDGTNWVQKGSDIDGEAAGDHMGNGHSIALSATGDRVVTGAFHNSGNGNRSGHARVYDFVEGNWVQVGADIDGEAADDTAGFGVSISADGSIIAVGAHENAENGARSGNLRVFNFDGTNWVQLGSSLLGEPGSSLFGFSNDMTPDGSRIVVGSSNYDGGGNNIGQARVFEFPLPDPVPTMGEWALIIFGLIIMSLGVITVRRRETLYALQTN